MNFKGGLGATYLGEGLGGFLVWAPLISRVEVHILSPEERIVPLEKVSRGYHYGVVPGVKPGARYFYRLDGNTERPDPASKFQPEGVHGPSQVIDPHFVWEEHFGGPDLWRPGADRTTTEIHTVMDPRTFKACTIQIRYSACLKLYPPMPAMPRPSLIAPPGPSFSARIFRLMAAWTRWVR